MKQPITINGHNYRFHEKSEQRKGREEPIHETSIDLERLDHDLREQINGEVRFDAGARALYATDGSQYRQVPLGVVIPRDSEDVIKTVATCRKYGAPLVMRGGGTSLAGQGCNVAVVIDMSKYMHQIIDLDPDKKIARVQPGIILDHLRDAAERFHLTFGPDPATHNHCTLGGMIGNNSCGVHSVMAGRTADNVEALNILTHDGLHMYVGKTSKEELEQIINAGGRRGEIYARLKTLRDKYADEIRKRYPQIPRRVSGYNLDELLPERGFHVARALVGTESTCAVVLEATVRLIPSPPARTLLVLGYPDIYTAADHVPELMAHRPTGLEGFDHRLVEDMRRKGLHPSYAASLPDGQGWLMVEFGGQSQQEANEKAQTLMESLKKEGHAPSMRLFDKAENAAKIWRIRESGLADTAFVPGKRTAWPGWEDSAVPPEHLGKYLRELRALINKYQYESDFYGHFGQGCVHTRIDFAFETAQGTKDYRSFVEEAADLVLRYGGSLSGEHGDGQARAELLPKMFGQELVEAFREFKSIWDPDWKMNPGKVVDPYPLDENLRIGPHYHPASVTTHFKYPDDEGSFARATLRCVGVGKCRRTEGGTMCPSFMVTREEADTTRGRAHLLFEMLQDNPIGDGWHDEHVRSSLDLCLSCKGCKGDCPINVDMATYKAEFLSHYYQGKLRPVTAYSMGLIYRWARLASLAPEVVNFFTQIPPFSALAKRLGGIASQRKIPTFTSQTFKQWFYQRGTRNTGMPQVILWPDTFNNYFYPQTAIAAVEVLEAAGYQVLVPEASLCCGRPLYDYGFLDLAKQLLRQILDVLRPQIEAGIPLVGLEPSCVAVFRDELRNLFPHDEDAKRLVQQSFLLSEFLEKETTHYQPPQLHRQALVHGHCHHKAIMKLTDEEALLTKLGLDFQVLDSGCCGMAGAFGFEKDHYDVSIKVGERVLLPAVREADKQTLIIADGFSCREQIKQTTDRQALHIAQVLQMALHDKKYEQKGEYPEAAYTEQHTPLPRMPLLVGSLAFLGSIGIVGWKLFQRILERDT
jgi:FAD/FMN-containing dehydrogenase/Fe-S oxidoreductase